MGNTNMTFWEALYRKIDRAAYRLGYLRAADELDRLGYVEEAKRCRNELRAYLNS